MPSAKIRSVNAENGTMQQPPVTIFPILRSLPAFVSGIPVALENLDLAAETPNNLL